ncbi:hypothetical protein Tco_0926524 [Tanacetum coccineum]|uniref:Uncharacterized protein n=1 Tax=Tanacetum coccineum TaxID=301880 RepID=A0ABQ5DA16_9ASTR
MMMCCGGVTVGRQRRCGWSGEVMKRVRESGVGDRIHREMGRVFGVGRICPPENFSGGGARWPAVGRLAGEDEWGGRDMSVISVAAALAVAEDLLGGILF